MAEAVLVLASPVINSQRTQFVELAVKSRLPAIYPFPEYIEAAIGSILTMPFVDSNRIVIGGQSRGGILSVAYAGQHPEQVKGVIKFRRRLARVRL